jgi:hypothetical protein
LDTTALIRAAERAGFELGDRKRAERRIEDYRARGLLPRPVRVGQEGRRTIWAHPVGTDRQLVALLRWRRKTRNNLEAVRVALWAEGFPIPLEDARQALLSVLSAFEIALSNELARFSPEGVDPGQLLDDSEALRSATEGWADELARMRGRFPIPRDLSARMTLAERQRAMAYWLAFTVGLTPSSEDAELLERLFGLTRGARASLAGILPDPEETFPAWMARHPRALRAAVETASDATLRFVQSSLQTFLTLFPLLIPVLFASDPRAAELVEGMFAFLEDSSPEAIALFAAALAANIESKHAEHADLEEYAKALKPASLMRELEPELTLERKREIADRQRQRMAR